ncbi:DMT family transporter [Paenibacillus gallinarum]|uniref:Multidrug efflux SMR transporter n=1 Tax=Paenibacillus gallinarum TaxID=2762232 RepID=A0ABR8SXC3_9BACL|nr:multidrug efflux SMR transporter [Paenibacillus gallinarum]MBD7968055.1 multidrug efflux SMR transporter [Paenibacillus gallinarum]
MNAYLILALAIIAEVFGSSMMKLSNGFKKLYPTLGLIVGMGAAFYGLSLALKTIPLGTAYAIWSGVGTALTVLVGVLVYKEKVNTRKMIGILLIIIGVVVMKLAAD